MDLESVIKKRWMCRKYRKKDVPQAKIDKILDLARRFPSAGHTQPQEFIVVRDQTVKDALGKASLGQMYLAKAPVVIVVVSDTSRSFFRYGERGINFYSILDGGFASMLILLSAVNEGLGAAFVGAFYSVLSQLVTVPKNPTLSPDYLRRKLYTVKNGNNNFMNEVILAGLLKIIV